MYNNGGGRGKQRNSSNNFIYPPNLYHGKTRNQMSLCHIRFILKQKCNIVLKLAFKMSYSIAALCTNNHRAVM